MEREKNPTLDGATNHRDRLGTQNFAKFGTGSNNAGILWEERPPLDLVVLIGRVYGSAMQEEMVWLLHRGEVPLMLSSTNREGFVLDRFHQVRTRDPRGSASCSGSVILVRTRQFLIGHVNSLEGPQMGDDKVGVHIDLMSLFSSIVHALDPVSGEFLFANFVLRSMWSFHGSSIFGFSALNRGKKENVSRTIELDKP